MATKWKNIIKKSKLERFFREFFGGNPASATVKRIRAVIGVLLFLAGILFFVPALLGGHRTVQVWQMGFVANAAFTTAQILLLGVIFPGVYRDWIPQNEDFYQEWKRKKRFQQQVFLIVLLVLAVLAAWFFDRVINYYYGYWGWARNYAPGYLMIATLVLQWTVARQMLGHFMQGRLDLLMDRMGEINQESLRHALEVERSSKEQISHSDQLRIDLITNVSHDLKTPLTSMVGYLELLKKEDLSDTSRDYLEVISKRAQKLKEMIESLFALAKASSGNIEFQKQEIRMNRLVGQLFADMEDRMKESGLEYVTLLAKEDTKFIADNSYMYRIGQNLLENALKYSAKGTRVFVKTRVEDSRVSLEVTNTAGYPIDFTKEDIVERFARADKARSSDGNGLGLAIVSTYSRAMGGEFDLQLDCDQFKALVQFPAAE